ncbi:Membrane protein involved in the export of O-antigen and teichoic acid [Marininema mesophilum]|uniref:Membrane protein involved in the export of O-antigen and teichoic acid n=1 Tax=Marininema mesophilum TaxID=1048340 RepID=A0A1H2T6F0_9BACL|nr:oligosaccharide flippase family protein [Marininema mesophilum]SDW39533.1 Membrane protein involved in the export of O-antigen and teichoic acid [Marininema mesophilum]
MFTKIRELFSDSLAFSLTLMGNKIVAAFILLPLYSRNLGTKIADVDQTNTVVMILTYFCIIGTDTAFAYYFVEAKNEKERHGYFTVAVFFPVLLSLGFLSITYFVSPSVTRFLYKHPEGYTHLLTIAVLTIVANVVIQQILAYARFARQSATFIIGSMSFVIGSNLASIWFLVGMKMGVVGFFYGQMVAQFVVAGVLLWIYRHHFTLTLEKRYLVDLLRYGVPLMPALLAFWGMTAVSGPILYHMVSREEAAIYGIAVRFASMIALITAAFQLAWRPFALSIKEREDARRIYSLLGRVFLVLGTLFILILTFFIEPLIKVVVGKPELFSAYRYVWMFTLGTLLNAMYLIVGIGLYITKRTKTISKTFVQAAVIYFVGILTLVPFIGIWGVAFMTVVAYLYIFLSIYRKGQKVFPIDFRIRSMLSYLAIFIGVMSFISWMQIYHWKGQWMIDLGLTAFMIGMIFMTGLFKVDSVRILRRLAIRFFRSSIAK